MCGKCPGLPQKLGYGYELLRKSPKLRKVQERERVCFYHFCLLTCAGEMPCLIAMSMMSAFSSIDLSVLSCFSLAGLPSGEYASMVIPEWEGDYSGAPLANWHTLNLNLSRASQNILVRNPAS